MRQSFIRKFCVSVSFQEKHLITNGWKDQKKMRERGSLLENVTFSSGLASQGTF
jgi:hypothetical protein